MIKTRFRNVLRKRKKLLYFERIKDNSANLSFSNTATYHKSIRTIFLQLPDFNLFVSFYNTHFKI